MLLVLLAVLFHADCGSGEQTQPEPTSAAMSSHEHGGHGEHAPTCHQGDVTATSSPASRGTDRAQAAPDLLGIPAGYHLPGLTPAEWPSLVRAAADPSPSRPVSGRALLRATEISRT